jgi:hypothetical protein
MSDDPTLTETFDLLRSLVPDVAHDLVSVIERRLELAEAMIRVYERVLHVAPGGSFCGESAASPAPGPVAVSAATAGADNVVDLHRYSWRVDGAAS